MCMSQNVEIFDGQIRGLPVPAMVPAAPMGRFSIIGQRQAEGISAWSTIMTSSLADSSQPAPRMVRAASAGAESTEDPRNFGTP